MNRSYWQSLSSLRVFMILLNFIIIVFGSIPCAVGYSVLSGFQPFGPGSAVLDLLDFLVSQRSLIR